jgi:low affinity Fe/Cu permease
MRIESGSVSGGKSPASRILHTLDGLASVSWFALTVVSLDLVWVAFSLRFEFPPRLETVFQTVVAAITLAMVFVIQHTQARQQEATQRKLDEILASLPDADKSLISLERAPDHELREVTRKHRDVREDTRPAGS